MSFDLRVISLGAGVQSTTMYLLACEGELVPRPDCAIFADTQAEPKYVYEHLDELERRCSHIIPIHRATAGSLEADVLHSSGGRSKFAALPLRVRNLDGSATMLRRQCTREYKLAPIEQKVRELLGLSKGERAAGRYRVEQWIGISLDEAHRARTSRTSWVTLHYPLLFDKPMRRGECITWLEKHGHPVPKKSACVFCPFHDDAYWAWLKNEQPDEFAHAVAFDTAIRQGKLRGVNEHAYLHRSLQPLEHVDFSHAEPDERQLDLFSFGEECEGMCGV